MYSENETMQYLREIFPDYVPRMEKASTEEELNALKEGLMAKVRQNLRQELAKANKSEEDFSDLLQGTYDGDSLAALTIDSTDHSDYVTAQGDKIKTLVQALYNSLQNVKNTNSANIRNADVKADNYHMAAALVVNGIIATSDAGISAADKVLEEYASRQASGKMKLELDEAWHEVLADFEEEDRKKIVGAFPGALPAAFAGVGAVGGAAIVVSIILVILAALTVILYFCIKDAACLVLVINDLADANGDYDKYNLEFTSSHNVHGKQTGYTRKLKSALKFTETEIFAPAGFFTTQKVTAALYGTCYGFQLKITDANLTVAFGVESPLTGSNKCYCGFGKTAEDAAKAVSSNLSSSANSGNYKATISMNSTSGETAYYIARVYK